MTVDGQPVFAYRYLTYNQFNWMDYASFSMTGKVKVTVTLPGHTVLTCNISPVAYGIRPQINGNTVSFELDRPRYLILFFNEEARFYSNGLMLFAEPPEKNPPKLGDPNVVNIQDYKIDNTGKTVETAKINKAISDVSAKPGGGVLFFPTNGVYLTGTLLMKSNVKLYVDMGAVIRGSGKSADYTPAPAPAGGRPPSRALIVFNNVENAGLMGRGTIDMDGYPKLWFDFAPDTSDGRARSDNGLVKDPHGTGIKGYVVSNCRNISFQDLLLLRTAYWTVHVSDTEYFSTRNIKIVNRKQQCHDDVYDFSGDTHILVEDGFGMTMDDMFALYRGRDAKTGADKAIEDFVVKGFVSYGYVTTLCTGYGGAAAIKHLRFEDVHFVSNQLKYAIWIQLTPAFYVGRSYPEGAKLSSNAPMDDLRFVNCSFENDGGYIYIDGGDLPLTNIVFENCTFHKATRTSLLMGKNVGPVLFKNVKMNGQALRNADQLRREGFDLSVPVKFEP